MPLSYLPQGEKMGAGFFEIRNLKKILKPVAEKWPVFLIRPAVGTA